MNCRYTNDWIYFLQQRQFCCLKEYPQQTLSATHSQILQRFVWFFWKVILYDIGLYKKERPPVKQNKKCWLKPWACSHLCVQSDMLENRQNLRAHSSANASEQSQILSILYHGIRYKFWHKQRKLLRNTQSGMNF